ncbi:hypothetical protein ACQP1W_45435 [Spirillospora sp. CA-255316]
MRVARPQRRCHAGTRRARFRELHDATVRGDNEIIGASRYVTGGCAEALLDAM